MGDHDELKDKQERRPRLNLTTSQVAASALAACSASIVASYLGVAGTVIGAAVGSVIATTGAAIWGHLFRRGGDKIKQTLLVNGQQVEVEVDAQAVGGERDGAAGKSVGQAAGPVIGRHYGAEADAAETRLIVPGRQSTAELWLPSTSATGETRVVSALSPNAETKLILGSGGSSGGGARNPTAVSAPLVLPSTDSPSPRTGRLGALRKYRKPMGIAAAILAVFSISIVVGLVAGAPVRSAGSSSAPQTTTTTATQTGQGQQSSASKSATDSTSTSGSGGTASQSPSSSSSATPSSSASPSASRSPSATSGANGGATASQQHQATAADTGSGAP